jgi:hypothetical protein
MVDAINKQISDDVFVKGAVAMRSIGGVLFLERAIPNRLLSALKIAESQLEHAGDDGARKRATENLTAAREELLIWAGPTLAIKLAPRGMIGR